MNNLFIDYFHYHLDEYSNIKINTLLQKVKRVDFNLIYSENMNNNYLFLLDNFRNHNFQNKDMYTNFINQKFIDFSLKNKLLLKKIDNQNLNTDISFNSFINNNFSSIPSLFIYENNKYYLSLFGINRYLNTNICFSEIISHAEFVKKIKLYIFKKINFNTCAECELKQKCISSDFWQFQHLNITNEYCSLKKFLNYETS
jgi:hypothetical protein